MNACIVVVFVAAVAAVLVVLLVVQQQVCPRSLSEAGAPGHDP